VGFQLCLPEGPKKNPPGVNRYDLVRDLHAANSIPVTRPHALADQIAAANIIVVVIAAITVGISVPTIVAAEIDTTAAEAPPWTPLNATALARPGADVLSKAARPKSVWPVSRQAINPRGARAKGETSKWSQQFFQGFLLPILSFEARSTREAQQLCKEAWLRMDMNSLKSNGVLLCDDTAKFSVRPATAEEAAVFQNGSAESKPSDDMLLVYLVELDGAGL
jgi:hypothetical protein